MAAPKHISKEFVEYFFTAVVPGVRPVSWEVALHTKNPGEGDDWEVSEAGYARVDVEFDAYEDPDGRGFWEASNTEDVLFGAALPGEDYKVSHYTVRDKISGECLAIGELVVPVPVVEGTSVSFPKNYLKVRGI